jgi:CHAD domain-containing protein
MMSSLRVDSTPNSAVKSKLTQLANKRLLQFATLMPKALLTDGPEVIHDLRVASRRLQQVLQLVSPKTKSSGTKKLLRVLRKVRRAFGPCRNLDVNIALVQGRIETTNGASARQAWNDVRLWLEENRPTGVAAGRAELRQHEVVDLIDRVRALLEAAEEDGERFAQLWERTKEALTEWKSALDAAKADAQVDRIHAFRIAGKRLRYRAELLGDLGGSAIKPMVGALKALQDDLGNWHDHSVLREQVAEFIGRPGFMAEEPGMCRALLLELERDKQRDRALIDEIIAKGEKLAQESMQFESEEPTGDEAQKAQ